MTTRRAINLNRLAPVNFRDHELVFRALQGNIVKGHGRDHAVNIFLEFTVEGSALRRALRDLAEQHVTSAFKQLEERERYRLFRLPGATFGNLFLTPGTYRKLGLESRLARWFADPPVPGSRLVTTGFVTGMHKSRDELSDPDPAGDEPLAQAYRNEKIDALLLLADDSEADLLRTAREVMTALQDSGVANVLAVEIGHALRNRDDEGIEHFGYVDGRSQPLFLTSDFAGDGDVRTERVNDKARRRESGAIESWDPLAPLSLVLLPDPGVTSPDAFGSYYVFRKLEQDVLGFAVAEHRLADALGLEGAARARAGAMIVGRYRDGTPLVLSETDGFVPAKANDFRYDPQLTSAGTAAPSDPLGVKCPFQAHIRKVNPRRTPGLDQGVDDRLHRIVRRGITYGDRDPVRQSYQPLDELPSKGVGLLFSCFQRSIINQFAFIQRMWANGVSFPVDGNNQNQTGIDPVIGQRTSTPNAQNWRKEYGGEVENGRVTRSDQIRLSVSHTTSFGVGGFVRFKGGEFFFAPSIPFLLGKGVKR